MTCLVPQDMSPSGFLGRLRVGEPRRGVFEGMSDQTLTCRDCGTAFTFTEGEQAFYQERGFSPPTRCPSCRARRKAERNASSGSYDSGGYGGDSAGSSDSYGGSGGRYGGGGYSSGPRQLYPAICSNCGRETEVPFQPRNDKPVYCRECFQAMRSGSQSRYSDY